MNMADVFGSSKSQPWQVYISRDFVRGLVQLQAGGHRVRLLQQLDRLAQGQWPYPILPHNTVSQRYGDILHVFEVSGLWMVWMVDVDHTTCTQIIRVIAVVSQPSELGPWLRRLQALLDTYTEDYVHLCSMCRHEQLGLDPSSCSKQKASRPLRVPAAAGGKGIRSWYTHQAAHRQKQQDQSSCSREDPAPKGCDDVCESTSEAGAWMDAALAHMKYFLMSAPLAARLCQATSDSQVEALLQLSAEETAAVYHQKSMLLAARSGTGKSTVIVHRLVDRELAYQAALELQGDPVQTKIPPAAAAAAATAKATERSNGGSPAEEPHHLPQLLVTSSAKLCDKLAREIHTILAVGSTHDVLAAATWAVSKQSPTHHAEGKAATDKLNSPMLADSFVAAEPSNRGHSSKSPLPQRFDHIQAADHPLIIPLRQLLDMLNASLAEPFVPSKVIDEPLPGISDNHLGGSFDACGSRSNRRSGSMRPTFADLPGVQADFSVPDLTVGQEVDFDLFVGKYWPRFDVHLTRNQDPGMVFAEILGTIKGCEGSLSAPRGKLSRQQYLDLTARRCSNLSEDERAVVYRLFVRYERLKSFWGQYDVMDLTHHIWQQLQSHGYKGPLMQYVYVDEAQDLVMAQLALLTALCYDVTTGLVIAGDTAQTITKGVAFRFADVGKLLYNLHYGQPEHSEAAESSIISSSSNAGSSAKPEDAATSAADVSNAAAAAASQKQQQSGSPDQISKGFCKSQQQQQQQQSSFRTEQQKHDNDDTAAAPEPKVPKRLRKAFDYYHTKGLKSHTKAIETRTGVEATSSTGSSAHDVGGSSTEAANCSTVAIAKEKQAPQTKPTKQAKVKQSSPACSSSRTDVNSAAAASSSSAHSWCSAAAASGAAAAASAVSSRFSSNTPSWIPAAGVGSSRGKSSRYPAVADQKTLRQNWRTQSKVLAVANSLTDVMYHMFPGTVDKLPTELSDVDGLMPTLLLPGSCNDPIRQLSYDSTAVKADEAGLDADLASTSMNAQTAVLVRDDSAAAAVRQLVGDAALVLTISEVKGLEFENVILHNLFSCNAAAAKRLRLLYTYLADKECLSRWQLQQPRFKGPVYDAAKHYEFNSDLKCFYVGVTRARSKLIMYESDMEVNNILQDFMQLTSSSPGPAHSSRSSVHAYVDSTPATTASLVEVSQLRPELMKKLQLASTKEEWADMGFELFSMGKFERAETCFKRALDTNSAKLCRAEHLRQEARRSQKERARDCYLQAGRLYGDIGRWQSAGLCLQLAGSFKEAAEVFRARCMPPLLPEAASCYCKAKCWLEAADCYAQDKQLDPALQCCLEGQLWTHGLRILDVFETSNCTDLAAVQQLEAVAGSRNSPAMIRVKYVQACAGRLYGLGQFQAMLEFVRLLPSNRQRTFLTNRGLLGELIELWAESHSWREAAAACEDAGDLFRASEMYEAHGELLTAARLHMRLARLLLLWPESAAQQPAGARAQASQLLLKAAQMQACVAGMDSDITRSDKAEVGLFVGLANGFANLQQVVQWTENGSSDESLGPGLKLTVSVEGFSYALRQAQRDMRTAGRLHSSTADAQQLLQLWRQLLATLLPVMQAIESLLRSPECPSLQQQMQLSACEYYMCVRPGTGSYGSGASIKTAERGSMLWCMGMTQPLAVTTSTDASVSADSCAHATSNRSSGGPLQLNQCTMLERTLTYWRWWLCKEATELMSHLQSVHHGISSNSDVCQPSDLLHEQQLLLLQTWEVVDVLISKVLPSSTDVNVEPAAATSQPAAPKTSCSIDDAVSSQRHCLLQHQHSLTRQIADVALAVPCSSGSSSSDLSCSRLALTAAQHMQGLLQQQQQQYSRLLDQMGWAVLEGCSAASMSSCSDAQDSSQTEPPPPQPDHLTYECIGQLCLLSPLLDADWVQRAALLGHLVRHKSGVRGCEGLETVIPWLRLVQAAAWIGMARSVNVMHPPRKWWVRGTNPVQQFSWTCCVGLRDYLQQLGLQPTGLVGGLTPHTMCGLLEMAMLSACAYSTGLDNLIVPSDAVSKYMSGPGPAGLYSWVVQHGTDQQEQQRLQSQVLMLAGELAKLITKPEAFRVLSGWCDAAARAPSSSGVNNDVNINNLVQSSMDLQRSVVQRLFWLLMMTAANNRPMTAAASSGSGTTASLPEKLQDVFLSALAQLAHTMHTGKCGAVPLLPEGLQQCLMRIHINAMRAGRSRNDPWHCLHFEQVIEQLLRASARCCSKPWVVLYKSSTTPEAPYWACKLEAIMVDQLAYAATCAGGESPALTPSSLFSVDHLAGPSRPVNEHTAAATASSSTSNALQKGQLQLRAAGSIYSTTVQTETDAATGKEVHRSHVRDPDDDYDQLEVPIIEARFFLTWTHWRLRCWRARARIKLMQLSPLQRLQHEARALMLIDDVSSGYDSNSRMDDAVLSAHEGASKYLGIYLTSACPLLVDLHERKQSLQDASSILQTVSAAQQEAGTDTLVATLLDEVYEVQETCQVLMEGLHPRCKRHQSHDLPWLHNRMEEAKKLKQDIELLREAVADAI